MADAWSGVTDPAGIGVTVKTGKGYEDTWYTFRGNNAEIRRQLIEFFGLDGASVAGLTTHDIAVNATQLAHGKGAAAAVLGATVIGSHGATTTTAIPAQSPPNSDGFDQPVENPLLARIEAVKTVDELKRLWAENQSAFADADLMAAWKARGKALQGGA